MQIFILDKDRKLSAEFLDDKRLPKMVLETAQILCSALNKEDSPYKQTHMNHPCCKWVRESEMNYIWLLNYGICLSDEFTKRFGKIHKSSLVIDKCCDLHMNNKIKFDKFELTSFPQAIPEKYKDQDAVIAYRNYYINEKFNEKYFKKTKMPYWIKRQKTIAYDAT